MKESKLTVKKLWPLLLAVLLAMLLLALWNGHSTGLALWKAQPTPTAAAARSTDATTKAVRIEEWRGVPDLIGTLYLAKCHGWAETYTRLYPVPGAFLTAAAASWPRKPDMPCFLAVSRSVFIPRTGKDVAADIDAWLSTAHPDCRRDPWDARQVKAIRGAGRRVAFFGMARPATREGKDVWEIAFAAILRSSTGGKR